jgi:hypothetical protein
MKALDITNLNVPTNLLNGAPCFRVYGTEINDNSTVADDGRVYLSEVSVFVNLNFNGINYILDYQTTQGVKLASYAENSDHEALRLLINDDDDFNIFLNDVAEQSRVQCVWYDYVEEHFDINLSAAEATRKKQ